MTMSQSAVSSTLVNDEKSRARQRNGNAGFRRWNLINVQAPLSSDEFVVQSENETESIAVRIRKADALSPTYKRTFLDGQTGQVLFVINKKGLSLTPSYYGAQSNHSQAFSVSSQPFTSGLKLKGHLTSVSRVREDVLIKADSSFTRANVSRKKSGEQIAAIERVYADAARHFLASQQSTSPRHNNLRQDMGGDRCSYVLTLAAHVDVAQVAAIALLLEELVRGSQDAVNATGGVGRVGGA